MAAVMSLPNKYFSGENTNSVRELNNFVKRFGIKY